MPASANAFRREEHEVDLCVVGGGMSGVVKAKLFADCSGDGVLAPSTGAAAKR